MPQQDPAQRPSAAAHETHPGAEPSSTEPVEPAETPERPERAPAPASAGTPPLPDYKGAPLEADRGPGLGCFWLQVVVLVILLVATPASVALGAEPWISAALLILVLILLLFVGQTAIFLLRLVAADRRTRRRPLRSEARKTVGMLEEERETGESSESAESAEADDASAAPPSKEGSRPARGEDK